MQILDLPNLRDAPFRLGVAPSEAVEHRSWREARDGVLARLAGGPAHVGLLGPAGVGKTLLLHTLARALQDQGRVVRVMGRGEGSPDLADHAVLLLDDAERLNDHALARIAAWDGSCVLAGAPALMERLPRPFGTVVLSPLSPDEVARFVSARLGAAGQRRDLLPPGAVLTLARLSDGAPRQINALAGAALFLAGLDGAEKVSPHHVEEAAALRDGDAAPPAHAPAPSLPGKENAPEPTVAPQPPGVPLVPRHVDRPRFTAVAAGAAVATLVLAGAVLFTHPGHTPELRHQPASAPPAQAPSPPAPTTPAVERAAPPAALPAAAQPSGSSPSKPAVHDVPAPVVPPVRPPVTPEPAINGPHVVVRYRTGEAAEADRLAKALAVTDPKFSHVDVRAAASTPRALTVRFFHPEDVGAAWELEATLSATGDTWQVSSATRTQPRPPLGTLEILLP